MWPTAIAICLVFTVCAGESLYPNIIENARYRRQNHGQQPQQAPIQHISYRPYNEAPDRIKQLLQIQQAREPLVHLPAQPAPQLQAASAPGLRKTPAPQPQAQPLVQPLQYNPKVQYNEAPPQPTYKGIQAIQAYQPGPQPGPQPGGPGPNQYVPQYKPQYNQPQYKPQYNQPQQPQPNALYRPYAAGPPQGQYRAAPPSPQQPPAQFPKNLPPHIQKIIESQRAYQG